MKELKKGDFTGIYSSIDGKPLYFTGVYSCMEYDGMPCVFLATDIHNNLTFCRWSQQDLNKRGFTIPPEPVRISKTAMQMIQKAGAVIRWTTAAERKAANTDHKRMSPYIITTAAGDFYTTGTCADVREILKAAQAAPEESTPATEANQDTTTGAQDGPTTAEINTAGENTTGAPEDATTRPQEGPTTAGTTAANETPTQGEPAPQEATSDAGTAADNNGTTEKAPERPETSTPAQDTTCSDTRPPRATEEATTGNAANTSTPATAAGDTSTPANQEPGTAAGDHTRPGPAAGAITGTAAGRIAARMKNASKAGHACEIAPGRTERSEAVLTTTPRRKTPSRGKYKATHARPPKFGKICAGIRVPSGALYFTGAG